MLLVHLEEFKVEKMPRYWIAKALLSHAENDMMMTLQHLDKAYSFEKDKLTKSLIETFRSGQNITQRQVEGLLPIRLAPREKRSQRR